MDNPPTLPFSQETSDTLPQEMWQSAFFNPSPTIKELQEWEKIPDSLRMLLKEVFEVLARGAREDRPVMLQRNVNRSYGRKLLAYSKRLYIECMKQLGEKGIPSLAHIASFSFTSGEKSYEASLIQAASNDPEVFVLHFQYDQDENERESITLGGLWMTDDDAILQGEAVFTSEYHDPTHDSHYMVKLLDGAIFQIQVVKSLGDKQGNRTNTDLDLHFDWSA